MAPRRDFFQLRGVYGRGVPSLHFYVIVGEALGRMLSKAEDCNLIHGFKPSQNAPSVSHLQYADDTLLFCNADEDQKKKIWLLFSDVLKLSRVLG